MNIEYKARNRAGTDANGSDVDPKSVPRRGSQALARGLTALCRILQRLATDRRATVSLLVAEGDEVVSVAVIVARDVDCHLSFREGSRHGLNVGAAGAALRAVLPPDPSEPEMLRTTRSRDWVITHGEFDPNVYGAFVRTAAAGRRLQI